MKGARTTVTGCPLGSAVIPPSSDSVAGTTWHWPRGSVLRTTPILPLPRTTATPTYCSQSLASSVPPVASTHAGITHACLIIPCLPLPMSPWQSYQLATCMPCTLALPLHAGACMQVYVGCRVYVCLHAPIRLQSVLCIRLSPCAYLCRVSSIVFADVLRLLHHPLLGFPLLEAQPREHDTSIPYTTKLSSTKSAD